MHSLIEQHREALRLLAQRHGASSVRVFGSMARGDAGRDSDVDLLVQLKPDVSGLALGGIAVDAEALLGRRVDVLTEGALHPRLRDQVLRSALVL
jgi:uncharacterized protein